MRFDLTDLRLFLHVVEAGSLTHGAARANLALPSASARLRGMEEASGLKLLERGRGGVSPTAAGEILARRARRILREAEDLRAELQDCASGARGLLRLPANTAAATEFLPEALADWLAGRPGMDVEILERPSAEILRAILDGKADFGVLARSPEAEALRLQPFALDRIALLIPTGHALAKRRGDLALAEALEADFVGLPAEAPLQAHLEERARLAGGRMRVRLRAPGFEALALLAAKGIGAAPMPEAAALRHRRRGLTIRRLSDPWASRELVVAARDFAALPASARALAAHLAGWGASKGGFGSL
ncbi:LysR family transcriptional regulator [Neomegalonema perideroedes]|uniref:LysR family transcriptional regulator n=1 Tax=Neomegalonema perideroedes TaxID=217219 RepID=UPI0003783F4E|nr:LysR family transcriptional regulator [Neomegalonema perideroedes]